MSFSSWEHSIQYILFFLLFMWFLFRWGTGIKIEIPTPVKILLVLVLVFTMAAVPGEWRFVRLLARVNSVFTTPTKVMIVLSAFGMLVYWVGSIRTVLADSRFQAVAAFVVVFWGLMAFSSPRPTTPAHRPPATIPARPPPPPTRAPPPGPTLQATVVSAKGPLPPSTPPTRPARLDPSDREAVYRALAGDDPKLADQAVRLLVKAQGERATAALRRHVRRPGPAAELARKALEYRKVGLAESTPLDMGKVNVAIEARASHEGTFEAIRALALMEGLEPTSVLRQLRKDRNDDIRREATRAWKLRVAQGLAPP